jgi:hypothetical protein
MDKANSQLLDMEEKINILKKEGYSAKVHNVTIIGDTKTHIYELFTDLQKYLRIEEKLASKIKIYLEEIYLKQDIDDNIDKIYIFFAEDDIIILNLLIDIRLLCVYLLTRFKNIINKNLENRLRMAEKVRLWEDEDNPIKNTKNADQYISSLSELKTDFYYLKEISFSYTNIIDELYSIYLKLYDMISK